jgi:hypothetical protein
MNNHKKLITFLSISLLIPALSLFTSCGASKEKEEENLLIPEFFIESQGGVRLSQPIYVTLPVSRSQFEVFPSPIIRANEIIGVAKAKVDLGFCLAFQLDRRGAMRFQGISADNVGSNMILMISKRALGVRLIDGVISDGRIYIFVEYPDDELDDLIDELQKSLLKIHEKDLKKEDK